MCHRHNAARRVLAESLPTPAGGLPVPRACRRGALRRHRNQLAAQGISVLQRLRSAHPDEGDGGAGHPRRACRVRARAGGGRAGAADAESARAAVQPSVEIPATLVVGCPERRGLPAVLGGAHAASRPRGRPVPVARRRRRRRRRAGPIHRCPHLHHAAGPFGAARASLPAARGVTVSGRPRRHGCAVQLRGERRRGADRRPGERGAGGGGRADRRARRAAALRVRGPPARSHGRGRRGVVARSAPAGAGRATGVGCRGPRRRRAAGSSPSSAMASSPRPRPPAAAFRRCPSSRRSRLGRR